MELVNVTTAVINGYEQPAVNARELWEKLESKQEFSNWIKNRLADFEEGLDYRFDKIVKTGAAGATGKQLYHEYTLTLDTAKHLAMLERNENGKKIRQYFIEIERGYYQAKEEQEKVCAPRKTVNIAASTAELINKINHQLIAGEEVQPEVLRYAWNIGRLVGGNQVRKSMAPDALTEFINNIAPGRYTRAEVYEMYCASCPHPQSPRWFWPRVRERRNCEDVRDSVRYYVVFK